MQNFVVIVIVLFALLKVKSDAKSSAYNKC